VSQLKTGRSIDVPASSIEADLLFICLLALVVVASAFIALTRSECRTRRPSWEGRLPSRKMNVTAKYRTADGTEDYAFRFLETERDGFRVYVISQPNYCGRSEDTHSTHRLTDSAGWFICWTARIESYEDAKAVAKKWAEATEKYIKHGQRF
jgi:hypothetical protein